MSVPDEGYQKKRVVHIKIDVMKKIEECEILKLVLSEKRCFFKMKGEALRWEMTEKRPLIIISLFCIHN